LTEVTIEQEQPHHGDPEQMDELKAPASDQPAELDLSECRENGDQDQKR
jgi:hypothetical protein